MKSASEPMESKGIIIGFIFGLLIGAGAIYVAVPRPDVSSYENRIDELETQVTTLQNQLAELEKAILEVSFEVAIPGGISVDNSKECEYEVDGYTLTMDTVITQTCQGGVEGTLTMNANKLLDSNGDGVGWGTWTWVATGGSELSLTGVAEGHYNSKYGGGYLVSAEGFGVGTDGDLEGWEISCWNNPDYTVPIIYYGVTLFEHAQNRK